MIKKTQKKVDKYSYICPYCKKRQTTIHEWQDASIGYEYDIKTQKYEQIEIINGENTEYLCPECNEQLDYDLVDKYID